MGAYAAGMLSDGDHLVKINGATQWLGVRGAEARTVPLLVVHGGPGANNWIFEQCPCPAVAARRTVVLHEQRGCGRSGPAPKDSYSLQVLADDVRGVIEALGVPHVDLLGWSFGGYLAARVALDHPGLVRRLVLQAPALDFASGATAEYLLSSFQALASPTFRDQAIRIAQGTGSPWEKVLKVWSTVDAQTVDHVGYHQAASAEKANRLYDRFGIGTNMDMLNALTAQAPGDRTAGRLGSIRQPALVLTGVHDHNVDPAATAQVAQVIPGARLVRFAQSAHMPDLEETDIYAHQLLAFLEDRRRKPMRS